MVNDNTSLLETMVRGAAAGIAGTVVMTAFQKLVEMPLTGRSDSYAPANFAEKILPLKPRTRKERDQLNYAAHFGLGIMWGSAYGLAAHTGLRGAKAVAAVFGAVYPSDVLVNVALGLYRPWRWSAQDTIIDVGEKLIQAAATGAAFDRILDPAR